MILGKQGLALLLGLVCGPAVADSMTYHNDRFEVHGTVPMGFTAGDAPGNSDGRMFVSDRDSARISIYGAYNHHDSFAAYRTEQKGFYLERGADVTYESGRDDWFVLSGYDEGVIFYVRVEQGKTCAGDTVLGHWMIVYDPVDRDRYDSNLGNLSKGLEVGSC